MKIKASPTASWGPEAEFARFIESHHYPANGLMCPLNRVGGHKVSQRGRCKVICAAFVFGQFFIFQGHLHTGSSFRVSFVSYCTATASQETILILEKYLPHISTVAR